MSAEVLRKAAVRARRCGTAPAALGPDYDDPRHLAVADWLEEAADHIEAGEENDDLLPHVCPTALEGLECSVLGQSLAVARAYLGESS